MMRRLAGLSLAGFLAVAALLGSAGALRGEPPVPPPSVKVEAGPRSNPISSAEESAALPRRPRVALVLSGGGARGLAHVGVLQVLEELHVPVDLVTGTSMGAIVGGLYAAGSSPEGLEGLVHSLGWNALIQDAPDRRHLPYRRKVDDIQYLMRWGIGVSKKGIQLPSGLVAGQRLGAALQLLSLRAVGIDDFDALPLPFRAVATDIATGKEVVLGRGDLAQALRASMAVPALFAPVELEGKLLVDGGVAANLPVEAARALGAEVVIAVDLGKPLAAQQRPGSIAGIVSRTLDFITRRDVERVLDRVEVLVRPNLESYGLLDFAAGPELVRLGAEAARAQAEALRKLAVDEATWQRYLERQRRAVPEIPVRTVIVEPGPGLPRDSVARSVRSRPGRPLDIELLEGDLQRLWELGEFETVSFDLEPAEGGVWDLRIVGRRKALGPGVLRTGLGIASDLEGESRFDMLGAVTFTRLDRLGGEAKVSAQIGEAPLFSAELYQPLAPSRIPFASLSVAGGERKMRIPFGDSLVQYRTYQHRVAFDLGLALGRYGEARVGVRHDGASSHPFGEGSQDALHTHTEDVGFRLNLVIDQLDRINFPRQGAIVVAELYDAEPSLGADDEYRRLDFQAVAATTSDRHTLLAIAHGTSALGGALPSAHRLYLGGLFNLSGRPPGDISGNYGAVASLIYLYRLGRLPNFGEGFYAGVSLEAGNAWERAAEASLDDLHWSWAVTFGADTVLGPLYLAHGRTEGGSDSFYLYLGRTF